MLPEFERDIEVFTTLGLSRAQVRVYFALLDSGSLTINSVSKALKLNRGDVFRSLSRLQQLNLVQKIVDTPAKFEAVPMQVGINILFEKREAENSELKKKALELVQAHKKNTFDLSCKEDPKSQFVLLPEKVVSKKIGEAVKNANVRLDVINTWKMRQLAFYNQTIEREKALKRGVTYRIITDKPQKGQSIRGAKRIKECPNHQLRYCETPVGAPLRIIDGKEVFILTSPNVTSPDSTALWSCCPTLVTIVQKYFDWLWLTSERCEHKTNAL